VAWDQFGLYFTFFSGRPLSQVPLCSWQRTESSCRSEIAGSTQKIDKRRRRKKHRRTCCRRRCCRRCRRSLDPGRICLVDTVALFENVGHVPEHQPVVTAGRQITQNQLSEVLGSVRAEHRKLRLPKGTERLSARPRPEPIGRMKPRVSGLTVIHHTYIQKYLVLTPYVLWLKCASKF